MTRPAAAVAETSSVSTPRNVLDEPVPVGHREAMDTRTFELRVDAGAMPCYEARPGPIPR